MCSPYLLAATLLLASLVPAQRVWIVNKAGGAGVDFTDIPPAIAAAAAGDTVRVTGGGGYQPIVLRKAVNVEAPSGTVIGDPFMPVQTLIDISGIPIGSSVRVSGFLAGARYIYAQVTQCAGTVTLKGLQGFQLTVTNSAAVLVADSTFVGFLLSFFPLKPAVDVTSSGVILQRCTLRGHRGGLVNPYSAGSAALQVASSTVVCASSTLIGGPGEDGNFSASLPCGTSGGPAISATVGSAVSVLGPSTLTGGSPGNSLLTTCRPTVVGDAASGDVLIASEATVTGNLLNGARRGRSLAWFDSPGEGLLGTVVSLTVRGAPQTTLQVFLDTGFGVLPVPGFPVPYQGTAAPVYLGTFVLGPSGALPLPIPVPYVPALSGWTFYFHALAFEAGTGAVSPTNPGDLLLK